MSHHVGLDVTEPTTCRLGSARKCKIQKRSSIMLAMRRWVIPSNVPTAALGGKSLFGAFTQSIGQELAHFPVGPALTDKFWCAWRRFTLIHGSACSSCGGGGGARPKTEASAASASALHGRQGPNCGNCRAHSPTVATAAPHPGQFLFRLRSAFADVSACRIYLVTWHVGLFLTLFLGQVGILVQIVVLTEEFMCWRQLEAMCMQTDAMCIQKMHAPQRLAA